MIKAATSDTDPRVRVSSIRALGAIKVAKSADPLLARGELLLEAYKKNLKPNSKPVEQNEFIEISTALGQVLAKTGNARAVALFREFAKVDNFTTTEPYIARVKVGGIRPGAGLGNNSPPTTYRSVHSGLRLLRASRRRRSRWGSARRAACLRRTPYTLAGGSGLLRAAILE